ncbi:hypothetical protein WA026_003640 [Henosepilachna vigintioctopunctata]|uniref:Uncharacterized protein n=1 Tax=Henosepilachna vigintioctopunctata TaxID=420089 RepID=A0AAW1U546_9CUCU
MFEELTDTFESDLYLTYTGLTPTSLTPPLLPSSRLSSFSSTGQTESSEPFPGGIFRGREQEVHARKRRALLVFRGDSGSANSTNCKNANDLLTKCHKDRRSRKVPFAYQNRNTRRIYIKFNEERYNWTG